MPQSDFQIDDEAGSVTDSIPEVRMVYLRYWKNRFFTSIIIFDLPQNIFLERFFPI